MKIKNSLWQVHAAVRTRAKATKDKCHVIAKEARRGLHPIVASEVRSPKSLGQMAKRARGPAHADWGKPKDLSQLFIPRELKFVDHGEGIDIQFLLHDDSK